MRSRVALFLLLGAATTAVAQVHDHGAPPPPAARISSTAPAGVATLSPELRELFKQEMLGLQGAMLELFPAVVAGDWEAIAAVAVRIQGGFVLAQKLTAEQREELGSKLPAGFLERDAEFHEVASGLEHAAHRKQADLVPFYVYKLTEGCVGCHSRYGQARFPALAPAHAAPAHAH